MNLLGQIALRGLIHHRRAHAATVAGAAAATAVLTGALMVGDSVRASLLGLVDLRLGRTEYALEGGERRFRAALADAIAQRTGRDAAAVLALPGSVSAPDLDRRAPRVDVLGVDAAFDKLGAPAGTFGGLAAGDAAVNLALAERLGVKRGDEIVVRPAEARALPADIPLGSDTADAPALRATVRRIVGDTELGRFSLRAQQMAQPVVFLPREELARALGATGTANTLLVAVPGGAVPRTSADPIAALPAAMTPADYGLTLTARTNGAGLTLTSSRIFLDEPVTAAALSAAPGARGVAAYFVNEIRAGTNRCPYSIVAAAPEGVGPADLADTEIVLNEWLAKDLGVAAGAEVSLAFFVPGDGLRLEERRRAFKVRAVVPLAGPAADPDLMPDFPGLREATACREWKPGIPLDLDRIRPQDEAYWDRHRGTPKAFVTLAAARSLWANRFGFLTAVRYPADTDPRVVENALLSQLRPEQAGLSFRNVRAEGFQAGAGGTDFGGLFVGLSFFLLAAALLLTALLFSLAADRRREEAALLRSLGYARRRVRLILLFEGLAVALVGGAAGAAAGIGYTAAVLAALRTVWHGAVGTSALAVHVQPGSVAVGFVAGLVTAMLAIFAVARRWGRETIRDLQDAGTEAPAAADPGRVRRRLIAGALLVALAGGALLAPPAVRERHAAALFFPAGALALVGGLMLAAGALAAAGAARGEAAAGVFGPRNWARRPRRSLAAIILPACGVFLVFAVGLNRPEGAADASARSSGTGGFALYAESALPISKPPPAGAGEDWYGVPAADLAGAGFLLLRLQPGDDASCLNLNRVARPPLLGVPAAAFREREAFAFARTDPRAPDGGWSALELDLGSNTIPAVADASVVTWGLGKSIGDRLSYVDEAGRALQVQIVGTLQNSIFQGRLLVPEAALARHFPSAGFHVALVDAAPADAARVRRALEDGLADLGLEATTAAERLAAFTVVERTYLDIFLALGGLGLLLGAAGFGVVATRNILERRRELAVLRAVGYRERRIARGLLAEHAALAAIGLAVGAGAALLAAAPSLRKEVALAGPAAAMLLLFLVLALLAVRAGVRGALRGTLLEALRDE